VDHTHRTLQWCGGPLVLPTVSLPFQCVLSGSWRSSVGCKMVVSELSEAGAFSGSYLSAAMAPKADRLASRLHGIQHGASPTEQPTFGFTVKWQFSDSMSVFVGQCFVDDQGEETLQTMWLLRQEVGSPGADWKATRWVTGHRLPRSEGATCRAGTAGPGPVSACRCAKAWDPDPDLRLWCWRYREPHVG
uniref:Avidin n=1 Tax=Gopherus evgoodei TaxID=1825980 RepID=A0A8C4YBL9_9SAUR